MSCLVKTLYTLAVQVLESPNGLSQWAAVIGRHKGCQLAGFSRACLKKSCDKLTSVQLPLPSSTVLKSQPPRMSNWLHLRRSRKDKDGKPEAHKGGRPEDVTITAEAGTPALDAASSTPDRSRLKTNPTTIEIQAIAATKTEEEHTSSTPAAAALAPARTHAKTKRSSARGPEDIWDQAYDSLREDDAKLVDAYEKILSSRPSAIDSASEATEPQNTIDRTPEARREQMHKLIQDGLQKTNREAKIIQGIGEAAQFVLSANDMISTALQAVPQAALAWTGVCLALQVSRLTDPSL